jgi:hypothetical protein
LNVALPVALERRVGFSTPVLSPSAGRVFSTKSRLSVKPGGAQERDVHGLQFGSLYIWSTASSERLEDSYRKRKTKTDAKRLHAV